MTAPMTRRTFLAGAAGAGAALGLAACSSSPEPRGKVTRTARTSKASLAVGMSATITSLSPFPTQPYQWSQMLGFALYDPLVWKNASGDLLPAIAESFDTSDPNVTVLGIRRGVKFHNGEALTARDVAYSIAARANPSLIKQTAGRPVMSPSQFKSISVTGDYTVEVHTAGRVEFLTDPQPILIVPENSFGKLNFANKVDGTGPFTLTEFVSGSSINMVANQNYWDGAPPIKTLTFSLFSDIATEGANLRSGEVDALYSIQPLYLDDVKNVSGTKVVPEATYMDWWIPQMGKAPLNNVDVRKALRYCFDLKALNSASFDGLGKSTWNPFTLTKQSNGYNATGVSYDPDRAKSLLAAAGASGISVPLVGLEGYSDCSAQALIIQEGLEAAGVKSEIQTLITSDWLDVTYTKGSWEGLAFNAGNLPFPLKNLLNYMVQPDCTLSAYSGSVPPVPAMNSLYNDVEAAAYNSSKEAQLLDQAQTLLVNDALVYFMFGGPVSLVLPDSLDGIIVNGFGDVRWNKARLT